MKKPRANHSDVVLESTTAMYPFRGFVHCLVDELGIRHGKQGVSELVKIKFSTKDRFPTKPSQRI